MEHFLALTLAGRLPHHFHGETAHFRWHWLGEGILELTPHARCERGLVLSCAIHGNETAPVEIVDQLVQRLVREAPAALAAAGDRRQPTSAAGE